MTLGLENQSLWQRLNSFDLKFGDGDGPNLCRVKK